MKKRENGRASIKEGEFYSYAGEAVCCVIVLRNGERKNEII